MVRKHFLIDEAMLEHLEALPGTLSEHIREALYQYLLRIRNQQVSSSASKEVANNE